MSEFPIVRSKPQWKATRTATKVAHHRTRMDRQKKERDHKAEARKRDQHRCRFPYCGCRTLKLALEARPEVSHDHHKGMGGNPAGDRSLARLLITLCLHRHQDSAISRHKGTLRTRYLSGEKNDGPVAWEVERETLLRLFPGLAARIPARVRWLEVARECAVQQTLPCLPWQVEVLEALASTMEY